VPLCAASLFWGCPGFVDTGFQAAECRSVRAFGVLGSGCAGSACCVVVRGFEDLLELVRVLLHAVFEQLGWGTRVVEKEPDSDPLEWVDQRVGLGQYQPADPRRFTR
jgi:hypothetical protein